MPREIPMPVLFPSAVPMAAPKHMPRHSPSRAWLASGRSSYAVVSAFSGGSFFPISNRTSCRSGSELE